MLRIALAITITAIGAVGTYVYWERKQKGATADAARRRSERKRHSDDKSAKPAAQPVTRQPGFGRR